MIRKPLHKAAYWLMAALAVMLTACSHSDSSLQPQEPEMPVVPGEVVLRLQVNAAKAFSGSRANEHVPLSPSELINTLRIILVRPSGKVEVNTLANYNAASTTGYVEFKVANNEIKTLYLIANEPGSDADFPAAFYAAAPVGGQMPQWLIDMEFNQQGPTLPSRGIPMTAVYRLPVSNELADANDRITYPSLQLLRAASKVTVNLINSLPAQEDPAASFVVTPPTLSSVAGKGYLFPHLDLTPIDGESVLHSLTYEPSRSGFVETATGLPPTVSGGSNAPLDLSYTDYFRDHYKVPATAVHSPLAFSSSNITVAPSTVETLTYYVNESLYPNRSGQGYAMSCSVADGVGRPMGSLNALLPNLDELPRNTHVVINIHLRRTGLNLEVDVMPYDHVDLRPGFGQPTD